MKFWHSSGPVSQINPSNCYNMPALDAMIDYDVKNMEWKGCLIGVGKNPFFRRQKSKMAESKMAESKMAESKMADQ